MDTVIDYHDVELHRQDLIALRHVNLTVGEGEFVYLIGKVGSGKSSLLKSLYASSTMTSTPSAAGTFPTCAARLASCFRISSC